MSDDQTYAVIKTGGKQYRVEMGKTYQLEKLSGEPGSQIELKEVLICSKNGDVKIGAPLLAGSSVMAEIVSQGRGKKITIIKFKRRKKYRRKQGHRQDFTEVKIVDIKAA